MDWAYGKQACFLFVILTDIAAPSSVDTPWDTWPDFLQHWALISVTDITGGYVHSITHRANNYGLIAQD